MPTSPESAVKKLSRLPSNCICPNCGTHSKYGFSSICIKYLTFVCNACKSSHQAISHRCKSLTMSSWDQGEVLKLKMHGNDYARRVWLGNGAPMVGVGGRPREGDDINVFKRFVVEVYERKRYYREPDGAVTAASSLPSDNHAPVNVNHAPRHPVAVAVPKQAPRKQLAPAPVVPTPPVVDLLDFGAFDSHPSPAPPSQIKAPLTNSIVAATAAASTSDPFCDPFNDTNTIHGHPAVATSHDNSQSITTANNSNNHAFLDPPSSGASNNASFDPFGNSSSIISTTSNNNSNGQPPPPSSQKAVMKAPPPVMMNHSGGRMNHGGMMNNNNHNGMIAMNGGMMNNGGNAVMMNGGMMDNNTSMMNTNNNGMMMMNGGMMNTSNHMMNMNGTMMSSNTTMQQHQYHQQQQQQPPLAMNINVMQPMKNNMSNNFFEGTRSSSANMSASAGGGASVGLNKKPDPFAGLGF